jgi:hypothetical protein
MKSSTIAIILSFTASTIAAPYAKFAKRDPVDDCGTNQAYVTVAQAIEGWFQSVDTVNQFLNDPTWTLRRLSTLPISSPASSAPSAPPLGSIPQEPLLLRT